MDQAHYQLGMTTALICIIQMGFNKIFRRVFLRPFPVRWPHIDPTLSNLIMGHFRVEKISMSGCFW